jgi:diaminohydroxyphosphoribosylaminopyrimidine deaminase/5-amino-6-(5-phosphoribosylamino)uracil reductase
LAAALLKRGLVDEVHWFAAPSIIGSDGRPSIGNMGTKRLSDSLELEIVDVRRVGSDLYTRAVLK